MAERDGTLKERVGSDGSKPKLPHPILGLAALFSGAALVAAVWFQLPLAVTLLCTGLFAGVAVMTRYSSLDTPGRRDTLLRLRSGLKAGIVATLAYDLWRLGLVEFADFPISPFESFRLFGLSILGPNATEFLAYLVGTMYHLLNGLTFSVAYVLLFRMPNPFTGIAWALGLEAAMFTVYPGWMDLEAVMMEFTVMSLSGHLVYGALLGVLGRKFLVAAKS